MEKMSFKGFIVILVILVVGHPRTISVKLYYEIGPLVYDEMSFKDFLVLALVSILFSGAEPFSKFW